VDGFDFTGPVGYQSVSYQIRTLTLRFANSSLKAGVQVNILDMEDISLLSIRDCRLGGQSAGAISSVRMEADTIDGGVSWRTYSGNGVMIRACWFRGGNEAVRLVGGPRGSVDNNRIEAYSTAIYAEDAEDLVVRDNTIRSYLGISLQSGLRAVVENNDVRTSDVGILVRTSYGDIRGNVITALQNNGIWTDQSDHVTIRDNVVGWCGAAGIRVDRPSYEVVIHNNTTVQNQRSGILVDPRTIVPVSVMNNIGYGNGEWGVLIEPAGVITLGCNDWFGNGLGSIAGAPAGTTDLAADPLFCSLDSADVRLDSASTLLEASECGRIGALGVGCGSTSTVVRRFTGARVAEGIQIVWEVAEGATASEIWVERAEGADGEAWMRPSTQRWSDGRMVVELDRTVVSDQAYRYRLMAIEGGGNLMALEPGLLVDAQGRPAFNFVEIGPSPGDGPVRVVFAVKHAAAIAIEMYDMQGRLVAELCRGAWPAGTHTVRWDGLSRGGTATPAGVYFLRYAYPGGVVRLPIVRLQ
jgi:hypothetical protein